MSPLFRAFWLAACLILWLAAARDLWSALLCAVLTVPQTVILWRRCPACAATVRAAGRQQSGP